MSDPLSHEQLRMVARLQTKGVALCLTETGVSRAASDTAQDVICPYPISEISGYFWLSVRCCLNFELVSGLTCYGARPIRR